MPIDKRVASAAMALADVPDGATILISGFGSAGVPNTLTRALRARAPRDLTLVINSATHRFSFTHELIAAGLVRKVICSSARGREEGLSAFEQRWKDGAIELELVPQGSFVERIRAGGAGIPAFYTRTGFGTELAAGKEMRRFGPHDTVLEHAITGDFALIRADIGDRWGNLTFRHTQANFGPAMATAARITVAEVRAAQPDPIEPARVQLPGVHVDRIVVAGA